MKIVAIIARTLLGLLFLFASIAFFFKLFPEPALTGNMKTFNDGLSASGYLLHLVKAVELVCGLAFVSGRFVPLAALLISPVIVNILCVNIFLDTRGLPVALFLVIANLFLGWHYRDRFKPLFTAK